MNAVKAFFCPQKEQVTFGNSFISSFPGRVPKNRIIFKGY